MRTTVDTYMASGQNYQSSLLFTWLLSRNYLDLSVRLEIAILIHQKDKRHF